MDHPFLYPDEAPWTDEYFELLAIRRLNNPFIQHNTDDDDDFLDFINRH